MIAVDAQEATDLPGVVVVVEVHRSKALGRWCAADGASPVLRVEDLIGLVSGDPVGAPIVEIPHRPLALRPVAVLGTVCPKVLGVIFLPPLHGGDRLLRIGPVAIAGDPSEAGLALVPMPVLHALGAVELR